MNTPSPKAVVGRFDFRNGDEGWIAGFCDYPANPDADYQLDSGIRPLPKDLGTGATGFMLRGMNRSDDLFMFLKRSLGAADGILPAAAYKVSVTIAFASNAPRGAMGTGGAPGESVRFKVGASAIEPLVVAPAGGGNLTLNIDKGEQMNDGRDVTLDGDIVNGRSSEDPLLYVALTRIGAHRKPVKSGADGTLWVLLGTESGFEGLTELYYQQIEVTLEPAIS